MRSITGAVLDRIVNKVPVPIGERPLFSPVGHQEPKVTRSLGAMEDHYTIFAIVDRISHDVGAATWRLFRKATRPDAKRVEVFSHPAKSVWDKPNPFQTRSEFVEQFQQHYELTGEWWWVLARAAMLAGGGPPLELWSVRPDRMAPVPDATEFIRGFLYGTGRNRIPLATDEVIYARRPNPIDPYRGLGPVGTLLLDLEGERAAAEWNANFFRNGAEPGGVLKTPEWLSDEEWKVLNSRWNQNHKGVGNAHRVAVAEGGLEYEATRVSMRDMQFEQLRRFSREAFREAWGFPKALLGDVEDVNRANAEAGEVVLARHITVPRLERIRDSLNTEFLPMFGRLGVGYEFDFDDPVPPNEADKREDTRMKVSSAVALIAQGADPVETLTAWGLPVTSFAATGGGGAATKEQIDAAGILIRSGFTAEAAIKAVGLDPIEHTGLLPITLQSPKKVEAEGDSAAAEE